MRDKIHTIAQSPDGRVKLVALPLVALLVGLMLLFVAVLPAVAGAGGATTTWAVQPEEVDLGGQPNDCSAGVGSLPSTAQYEYRIENPQTGTYQDPVGGATFTLTVTNNEKVDFTMTGGAVFDVVVKGGQKSTHFDYDAGVGPKTADTGLHPPTKGNGTNLYTLSHTTFCYSKTVTISGTVYADVNADGSRGTGEAGRVGWTVQLKNTGGAVVATATTGSDGTYSFLAAIGTYTVCAGSDTGYFQTDPVQGGCRSVPATTPGATYPGNDFGIAQEICGQELQVQGTVFVNATFTVFADGDSAVECRDKAATLFENNNGELGFVLSGSGTAAAIGVVQKDFAPTLDFSPLEYKQSALDTTFEVVPWCGLRAKVAGDNDSFDPYLTDVTRYPSLDGVFDPDSGVPAVSCKVAEVEDATGYQLTVLYAADDPFYR